MARVRAVSSFPAAALFALAASAQAATYHVDRAHPACSNSGPGTEARPYCSISAAVGSRGGPGVTIRVRPGVYPEQVSITDSGTADAPFVVQATADSVVVDGADDLSEPGRWVRHAGDVWLASGVSWNPTQVFLEGARLAPSEAELAALPARSFKWVPGAGLYVHAGGGSPAGRGVRASRRTFGFVMYGRSWVTIDGFRVTGTQDRGILVSESSSQVTIIRNTVTFASKMGIQVVGGSGMRLASNTVSDNNDHGISMRSGVTGSVLEDNESCRNARPGQRAANGIYLFACPGNVLRRNRLHHNQDTGLDIQNGSNDCVSYLNRSWSNGDHGYDHLEATGTIHVCDVAWGNYKDGFSVEGNSTGTRIYNSIAVDNGLTSNEFDLWVDLSSTHGFVSNYNIFWNSTRQAPVKYITALHTKVSSYSSASRQDAQTLQADPRFVDPAAGDFRLQPDSPAIDNADSSVPHWPSTDAEGGERVDEPRTANGGTGPVPHSDRGALEFRAPRPAPLAAPSPR